jgi:hypothetical protein
MLIPIKPSRALHRPSKPKVSDSEHDVHLEVIPPKGGLTKKVGQAKVTGRTAVFNRKPPE